MQSHRNYRWMFGLLISCLLGFAVFAASAQIGEGDSCLDACAEAHGVCVDQCSQHNNPMECEAQCDDALEDCRHSCR